MKKQINRKIGFLALLLAASLWGCDQLAVTGVDTLEPGAAAYAKGGKLPGLGGDEPILEPLDYGIAWPW